MYCAAKTHLHGKLEVCVCARACVCVCVLNHLTLSICAQEAEKDKSVLDRQCCQKPGFRKPSRLTAISRPAAVYAHRSIVDTLKLILSVDNVAKLFLYQLKRGPGLLGWRQINYRLCVLTVCCLQFHPTH